MRVTVVVADDEEIVREGLAAVVGADPGLAVVATVGDGAAAVDAARRTRADVVLMDVRMPGVDGVEATRRLSMAPEVPARVLVLTTVESDEVVVAALRAGASGFLLKSAPRETLYAGIRAVAAGEALLAPSVTRRLIESVVAGGVASAPPLRLTDRQRDVVRLVAAGASNTEIARALHLAPATVKGYVSDVLLAHDLRDRAQLVVRAYESGLVRPGDAGGDPA